MPTKAADTLRHRIEQLTARADNLRQIQMMLDDDPGLAAELLDILLSPNATATIPTTSTGVVRKQLPHRRSDGGVHDSPHLDRLVAYFRERENEWATARDMAESTGLSRNSINALLYTSKHKELFDTELAGPKRRLFRLKGEPQLSENGVEVLDEPPPVVRIKPRPAFIDD